MIYSSDSEIGTDGDCMHSEIVGAFKAKGKTVMDPQDPERLRSSTHNRDIVMTFGRRYKCSRHGISVDARLRHSDNVIAHMVIKYVQREN